MAQPTNTPRWNTAGANRTDPPSGQKDSGFVASSPLVSAYLNWLLFNIYEWVLYLKNLTTEALTWTVLQTFNVGIVVTTSVVNGDAVTATGNGTGSAVKGTAGAAGGYGGRFINALSGGVAALFEATHAAGGKALRVIATGVGIEVIPSGNGKGIVVIPANNTGLEITADNDTFSAATFDNQGSADTVRVTSAAGRALYVEGGEGAEGAYIRNNGAGNEALIVASWAAGKSALKAIGAAGTTPSKAAEFTGGDHTSGGVGATAAQFTGGNAAPGLTATGGTGFTQGATFTGGSAGGPGLRANNGLDTVNPAIDSRGMIELANSTAPAVTVALPNKITKLNLTKAIAHITLNGTATPGVDWGQNVASVSQAVNGEITVTFPGGGSFSTAEFGCAGDLTGGVTSGTSFAYKLVPISRTTSTVVFEIHLPDAAVNKINRTNSNGLKFMIRAWGPQ